MAYKHANLPPNSTPPNPIPDGHFQIHTPAPTDIWRKPPGHDVFNAPMTYKALPISSFKRARVTATGDWKTLYDQGGLVLVLPAKKAGAQKRWVKCGIEFYNDVPRMSVVAADEWADWSLSPLSGADEAAGRMTVEAERDQKGDGSWGSVLRISLVDQERGRMMPIREITWAFHDLDEAEEMWVGVFAAKPTRDERDELVVNFEKFEIETRE